MRRKHFLILMLTAVMLLTSSCALMPEEEVIRTAPLIREYVSAEYELAAVERDDLISTEKLSARYVPVQQKSLGFSVTDEYVDQILVKVGDFVEKGQLVAQLRVEDIERQIESVNRNLELMEIRIAHFEQQCDLELRRMEIQNANLSSREQQEALAEREQQFAASRKELADALEIEQLQMETLQEKLEERQIFAPFSGTITYVRDYEEGDVSSYAQVAVIIADSTMTLFRAETKNWDVFHEGDQYEIVVSGETMNLEVIDDDSLGIAPQEKKPGQKAYVYFQLLEPNFSLEEGDYGTIEAELERRENVLCVPSDAVAAAGDKWLVYYLREDGMKSYKEVEIGLTVGKKTEIVSGLTEGEFIIVS